MTLAYSYHRSVLRGGYTVTMTILVLIRIRDGLKNYSLYVVGYPYYVSIAGLRLLRLSYPVRYHGIAFLLCSLHNNVVSLWCSFETTIFASL